MDLDELNVSAIIPQNETEEQRQERLYARPPERFTVDNFKIGDHVHYVKSKTATKLVSGILLQINDNEFTIYLLGNNKPGTLDIDEFPGAFYYLDIIKPTRKLDLDGSRNLVGMHVCIHMFGESRRLGFITDRTNGYIHLKLTQIEGLGTIQSFREDLVADIYWTPFIRFFPDELVQEDAFENHTMDCRLQPFLGESGIPDADELRKLNPLELYKCFLRYGEIDLISKQLLPGLQSHVDEKRNAAEEDGCDTSHYIRFGSEEEPFT